MVNRSCTTCVYAWWEPGQWMAGLALGFPSRPVCANHPDSPGRMTAVPYGGPCRNYRAKPATPEGDVKRIPLAGGLYAYVDAADYEWLNKYRWSFCNGYAARYAKGKPIYMHRQIMNTPEDKVVDHIDRNRLNDCRSNLRNCTMPENTRNRTKCIGSSSRFWGVSYCKRSQRYSSGIRFAGKSLWLGYYDDEVAAARAYDRKAVELFGEFARLNFPEEWPAERRREVHEQWLRENGKRNAKGQRARAGRTPRRAKASAQKGGRRPPGRRKQAAGRARRKALD